MEENGEIEGPDEEFPSTRGRQYLPVGANDRAVLQMSSIEGPSGSSSEQVPGHENSLKKIKVTSQANMRNDATVDINEEFGRNQSESKLELFGFDSLVNILGLKSMTGEQIAAPSSPRDGEDVSMTLGRPKPTDLKLGTMMGVFVPCLQNILGIIYYIRFSWSTQVKMA